MTEYIEPIQRLADKFRRLDGIGAKTAVRLAFCVMNFSEDEVRDFADAMIAAKTDICLCQRCQNLTTEPLCSICSSDDRDESVICVVEDPRAVIAIEKMHGYRGVYHVLHGAISPMRRIGPEQIKIKELMARIEEGGIGEVILATNSTVEGEATAMYLSRQIAPYGVKISRIANGVPVGGDLEYTDEITLKRALEGRYDMN
ncbi:MAG: recombination protein RecR [Clostridia bacterium]|nr:recombination protein RecR [Clostridia bacterium]